VVVVVVVDQVQEI